VGKSLEGWAMRHFISAVFFLLLANCSNANAESGGGLGTEGGGTGTTANAFTDLNHSFVQTYSATAEINQKGTRPILITSGFSYKLLCEDGSVKTGPAPNPVENQLKAVSHVCAYLYAISDAHWRDPKNESWKQSMAQAHNNFDKAIDDIDRVSWASNAWPRGEKKLKDFIRQSLTLAREFARASVAKNDVTRADYEAFATKYTPTLQSTFYLTSLSNAFDTQKFLKQWKQEMGDDAWSRMRVIITAGQGRSTAGLTADTNPAAVTIASVMTQDQFKKNVLMDPGAATTEDALEGLGLALTSSKLADAIFPTEKSHDTTWIYSALKHPNIPLALDPVRSALNDLAKGHAKDPILGLGPNE
jgi:hypothetical protein